MRALVIDDARAMRSILRQMLRPLGFEVAEAGDGRAGLEALRREGRPDVAFVDWNMPVMGGLDFVRAVRADAALAGLRLVLVTSEEERAQADTARAAGADGYVSKPFTPATIRGVLERLGLAPATP
jgi:two-component system, chemotaxis family, chemotaxis protein CheY